VLQCKEVISIRVYCKYTIVHRVTSYTIKVRNMECKYDNQPSFEHKMPNIYNGLCVILLP
jgi:hypothetical protein